MLIGSGPPGIQPPLSFHAEQWYPSNLPTVLPPWKEAGLDIDTFRTSTMSPVTISVTSSPVAAASTASDDSDALLFTAVNLTSVEANETTFATSTVSALESTMVTAVNLLGDAFNSSEIPSEFTEAVTIFNSSEISSDINGDGRMSTNSSEILTANIDVARKSSSSENSEENSGGIPRDASASRSGELSTESAGNVGLSNANENTSENAGRDRTSTSSDIFDDSTRESRMSSSTEISTERLEDAKTSNSSEISSDVGRELTIDEIDKLLILSAQAPTMPEALSNLTVEGNESDINLTSSTLAALDPDISNNTTEEQVSVESSSTIAVADDDNVPHNSSAEESGDILNKIPVCSDLFFVLDSSGNVLEQYDKQKLYIGNILMQLSDKDRRYGLMTYAGRTRQRINIPPQLNISKDLFVKKLLRARFLSGITATGAALRVASELQFVRRTDIVVVTDGFSFDSVNVDAQRLRERSRVRVLVTGDYTPVVREVLNSIAGDPLNVFLGGRSTDQLVDLLNC
ncbi:von Willebrand factor type A domain protein [Ostertagia ostertagi]